MEERGPQLTPKFGSVRGTLGFQDLLKKAKMSAELAKLKHCQDRLDFMTLSSREWALPVEDGGDQKQEGIADLIERKD